MLCLILLLSLAAASPLTHKIIDAIAFPGASTILHTESKVSGGSAYEANKNLQIANNRLPQQYKLSATYYLTNDSTPIDVNQTVIQPLGINCKHIYNFYQEGSAYNTSFDINRGACDGWDKRVVPDALRYQIEFTTDQMQGRHTNATLTTINGVYYFTCKDTKYELGKPISYTQFVTPNGAGPYHCYMFLFSDYLASDHLDYTYTPITYMGVAPPIINEIVITRYGDFHINGVRVARTPQVLAVYMTLPLTQYILLFAQNVPVLVSIVNTQLQKIQYCDTEYEKLLCDNSQFSLADGFYVFRPILEENRPTTFVTLPATGDRVVAYFDFSYNDSRTNPGLGAVESYTLQLRHYDKHNTIGEVLPFPYCVQASQFTLLLRTRCWKYQNYTDGGVHEGVVMVCDSNHPDSFSTGYGGAIVNIDCPFDFQSINNYLQFDTLCLSAAENPTGCRMSLNKVFGNQHVPVSVLYFTYSYGFKFTTLPYSASDADVLILDTCTDYTIFGASGTGIIRETNITLPSGMQYYSAVGQIIAFKNTTTGVVYTITPCSFTQQVAVVSDMPVALIAALPSTDFNFTHATTMDTFSVMSNNVVCDEPAIAYSSIGICRNGAPYAVQARNGTSPITAPISTEEISIPANYTVAIQTEYIQLFTQQYSVDCQTYVCGGNTRCLLLLQQYTSACESIQQALQLAARLESQELASMIVISPEQLELATPAHFDSYNLSFVLPAGNSPSGRSALEDLLFTKVVTAGLGTVDADYAACTKGLDIADLPCAQWYNGIMVLPGVVNEGKMAEYTASLTGGMVMGGITAAASIPFSMAVQARINYVALQTGVMVDNQKMLADSFNKAMDTVSNAFKSVNSALQHTSESINTIANALTKVQTVVNQQGLALSQLTSQLSYNFQAISSSISDIYQRLTQLEADIQVDRLITGRLSALNAFVSQCLVQNEQSRQSRVLATQKINECVKSQSSRYGFCGNGTHLFSVVNSAPNGLMFLHTVLQPTSYKLVRAYSGLCVDHTYAMVVRDPSSAIIELNQQLFITPRSLYEPRPLGVADLVRITNCGVLHLNATHNNLTSLIPDYVDVNQTVDDIINRIPNYTVPDLSLDIYNSTLLNLSQEIADIRNSSSLIIDKTQELDLYIQRLNDTLVNLEWLNRVETYVKWPWWVWLLIFLAIVTFIILVVSIFLCTGCCGGCFGCCGGCCGLFSRKRNYEFSKLPTEEEHDIPITYKKVR
uniref:Spike glycoprotein n=1 Tax=Bird deltacoronavirus AnasCN24 TaxID=3237947 RepID=A0AB39AGH1_9NIDO